MGAIAGAGVIGSFVNTLAGGGSMVMVPAMMMAGCRRRSRTRPRGCRSARSA
jgi:uncharacterized membrane protein YfcA